jgi:hypothetical protein
LPQNLEIKHIRHIPLSLERAKNLHYPRQYQGRALPGNNSRVDLPVRMSEISEDLNLHHSSEAGKTTVDVNCITLNNFFLLIHSKILDLVYQFC